MQEIKKILCPIAGTEESNRVLDSASMMALRFGAQLTVLNVAPLKIIHLMSEHGHLVEEEQDLLPQQVQERLELRSGEVLARAREHLAGIDAEFKRVIGHPGSVICDFAKEEGFDLIVVGNRKHNPLQGMVLGSVSDHVVQHSPCPVLVVGHHHAR